MHQFVALNMLLESCRCQNKWLLLHCQHEVGTIAPEAWHVQPQQWLSSCCASADHHALHLSSPSSHGLASLSLWPMSRTRH
jgi:hypothetical protein